MEKYLRWFAGLVPFYQILLVVAFVLGLTAVMTGLNEGNPVFLVLGVFWLVVGPGVVWLLSERDND